MPDPYEGVKIDDIDLNDTEMPLSDFMGKTIEKVLLPTLYVDFKFTNGTYGFISLGLPAKPKDRYEMLKEVAANCDMHLGGGVLLPISLCD